MIDKISASELAKLENRVIELSEQWDIAARDFKYLIDRGTFWNVLNPIYHIRCWLADKKLEKISEEMKKTNIKYRLMRRKAFSNY
jgi:hypothetical protein